MQIHHLNCATLCPMSARLVNGIGAWTSPGKMVCHCLLIESNQGLILVDTGFGLHDIQHPRQFGFMFLKLLQPRLDDNETAVRQVARLGFNPNEVRHIIVTHLDADHAGGLPDFPQAMVHVYDVEYQAAMAPRTRTERLRYLSSHWSHRPRWQRAVIEGEQWYGFDGVRAIAETLPDILLIPLAGHTRGHCGVAVRNGAHWLLHCGDAYFYHGEMALDRPSCTLGLALFQYLMAADRQARGKNQHRLRALKQRHHQDIRLFCSHDDQEFADLCQM